MIAEEYFRWFLPSNFELGFGYLFFSVLGSYFGYSYLKVIYLSSRVYS